MHNDVITVPGISHSLMTVLYILQTLNCIRAVITVYSKPAYWLYIDSVLHGQDHPQMCNTQFSRHKTVLGRLIKVCSTAVWHLFPCSLPLLQPHRVSYFGLFLPSNNNMGQQNQTTFTQSELIVVTLSVTFIQWSQWACLRCPKACSQRQYHMHKVYAQHQQVYSHSYLDLLGEKRRTPLSTSHLGLPILFQWLPRLLLQLLVQDSLACCKTDLP